MTRQEESLMPNWASPPGDTISDVLQERGWSQGEFARRLGYSDKHVSHLLRGIATLTRDTAEKLEKVIGGSVDFWLAREAKYRERKERLEQEARHKAWSPWLDQIPVRYLMKMGIIPKLRMTANNKPAIVKELLHFFSVASPAEWESTYVAMEASFRRSQAAQTDIGAISAWLRLGEIQVEKSGPCPNTFNKTKFKKALKEIRSLTRSRAEIFSPKMKETLWDAGVQLIFVESLPRAQVSGVARWLNKRPVIQLSLFGRTNDKFWFTFFHEAAHILLHSNNAAEKKLVFLDNPEAESNDSKHEREANEWAANFLISEEYVKLLPQLKTKSQVKQFAKEVGIHPGIVVGRLQHEQIIPFNYFNDLKQKFRLAKKNN